MAKEVVQELNMNQSTVSRHLTQLQRSNLVTTRSKGNAKYYSINRSILQQVIHSLSDLL